MTLAIEEVKKVAKLSRIGCGEQDLGLLKEELSKILDMIETLKEVQTDHIEPLINVSRATLSMREDIAYSINTLEDVLANAPVKELNCFVVPKVIE
ncbi:Glutamyl-tRNA(Gln) amidotransferase subunit C [Rickettsiales bacterium Ac37b]|nr:Glutamyl-tRNA(Gln) amidotransferase subunit C [Rickettsiales bacterium Ac37b]